MTTRMTKRIAVAACLMAVLAYGGLRIHVLYFTPESEIVAHLYHARWWQRSSFQVPYDPWDSIGAAMTCLDEVHSRGGGYCEIEPKSMRPGRHNSLYRKYEDAEIRVRRF